MSKYADSVYKINNNIFVFTPLFVAFYKNLKPNPKNLLLSYLVLPLVLHKTSQEKIKNSKTFMDCPKEFKITKRLQINAFYMPLKING